MKVFLKILIGVLLFTTSGCGKFLEGYSPNLVTIRKLSDLDEVLIGSVYIPSRNLTYLTSNQIANWLNYIDDDIQTVVGASASINPLGPFGTAAQMGSLYGYTTWQLEVTKNYQGKDFSSDYETWRDLYKRINVINILLDEIEQLKDLTDEEKKDYHRIKGECHFLRAQFYFTLVNIYGKPYAKNESENLLGVPLKLTNYVEHIPHAPEQFKRTSVKDIYEQLIVDLKQSIENFGIGSKKETTLRANEDAAAILLSRVYLFMQDFENAKIYSAQVISNNPFLEELMSNNLEYVFFNRENSEVLFSQGSLNFQSTFFGAPEDFCVSSDLIDVFDVKDKRFKVFFKKTLYSDSTVLSRKYISGVHQSYVSDQFMLRVGEAYLNNIEALCMLGEESEANTRLNYLKRNRIGEYVDEYLTGVDLVNEIRDERRRELCFEGHRWFDLRRYSVHATYPYSKQITRRFAIYTSNGAFVQAEEYELKPHDPAYTLQIPVEVREFQPNMPLNERQARKPSKVINIRF